MRENFVSLMGKISVDTLDCCEGCPKFQPVICKTISTDENGNVKRTKDGELIDDGMLIRCDHIYLCEQVRRDLIKRIKNGFRYDVLSLDEMKEMAIKFDRRFCSGNKTLKGEEDNE